MIRRTVAILIALVSLFALGACSSSDNAKKVDSPTTTTADETTTTEEETTTTEDEGLKSKIDLGGLSTQSASGDDSESCIAEGILDDPVLSTYTSLDELKAGPQEDREAFFSIYIDCVGSDTVVDQFLTGFNQSGSFDDVTMACVRVTVEGLTQDEGAKLLAEDPDVTAALTDSIKLNCIAG